MRTPIAYSQSDEYWESLTDSEVRVVQFEIERPEELPDLLSEPPSAGSPRPRIEYHYDTRRNDKRLVRCAHCGYPNHNEGFVCLNPNGTRFLVGNKCGKQIFPEDFQDILARFRRARERAGLIHDVEHALGALPEEIRQLTEFARSRIVAEFDQARAKLRSFFPGSVGKELRAVADRDGALQYDSRVRDFSAEERHKEKFDALSQREQRERVRAGTLKNRDAKFFRMQRDSVGFLAGYQLLATREPLGLILIDLMKRLLSSAAAAPSEPHRKMWLRNLKDIRENITAQRKSVELLDQFFSEANFRRVANWVAMRFENVGTMEVTESRASWIDLDGIVSATVELRAG